MLLKRETAQEGIWTRQKTPFTAKKWYWVVWKTSTLQTSSSGKEEERKEALITITKSKDIKDLEQDFKNYLNDLGAWGSSTKASQGLQKISSLETMARTIQGAQCATAASKDHAPLGPTPTFHLTKPLWRWELLFHGAAPGWHLGRSFSRRKPGRHTTSETGQGGPSWSHSSPLPSGGGTSEAILFSSPNDVLLSYSLLTLFRSSPLPYLLLFEPCSCNPQSPFFSFYFLVHSRRRALIETAKGYDSEPSRPCFTVGKILLSA